MLRVIDNNKRPHTKNKSDFTRLLSGSFGLAQLVATLVGSTKLLYARPG